MDKKCHVAKGYYKFMGCFTGLFNIAGLVFYIILMVQTFNKGIDWLTGTWLVLGLVAMVTILPALANFFIGRGCENKYHLNETCE